MKRISADLMLTPTGELVAGHQLTFDDRGTIHYFGPIKEQIDEHFSGTVSPGFINTHCHLELSHLENRIPQKNGLHGFISDFLHARKNDPSPDPDAIKNADHQMWENGIMAVADICNTADSFAVKQVSKIVYHCFIELFDIRKAATHEAYTNGLRLYENALTSQLAASLTPHAPYSVSDELFSSIAAHNNTADTLWSLHNQESSGENELFELHEGKLFELMQKAGVDFYDDIPFPTESIQRSSRFFPEKGNILLVHNTFIREKDLQFLFSKNLKDRIWFCLCPLANLYIEDRIPDIALLRKTGAQITIGTDSLASNHQLSVLEELKTIAHHHPEIGTGELLHWATSNGAAFMRLSHLGSFEIGRTPGILNFPELKKAHQQLQENISVRRIK
jgi:cytosine/adenosine deaminase-related metal-dependent hydrolase